MPRTKSTATSKRIYQLKITLQDIKPAIWRRVEVDESATLADLHDVVQMSMGWFDSHLHQFIVGDVSYSSSDLEEDEDAGEFEFEDEGGIQIKDVLKNPKDKIMYEYDFGDSWEHEIVLEKIVDSQAGAKYPRCTAGKRACPPEDCGGVIGYNGMLEAFADEDHPEHDDIIEWLGDGFDPEEFDIEMVNDLLQDES